METLVLRRVINGGRIKLKLVEVGPKKLIGEGLLKLERVHAICPACGQQIEAVTSDGRVKGYCAVAKQYVDFPTETQLEKKDYHQDPEYLAMQRARMKERWQDPEFRAKQIATHTGKHPTAKTKAKISAALKRGHNTERGAN